MKAAQHCAAFLRDKNKSRFLEQLLAVHSAVGDGFPVPRVHSCGIFLRKMIQKCRGLRLRRPGKFWFVAWFQIFACTLQMHF